MKQLILKSKFGSLFLIASEKGLQGVFWEKQNVPLINLKINSNERTILIKTKKQLEEYFSGKRQKFDLKIDLVGTEFQKKVWSQLMKIPYGSVMSYKDIAKKIKNDKAVRAVGTANGKNPLCLIIPCHRVIKSTGETGGYSGLTENKEYLLSLERIYKSRKK